LLVELVVVVERFCVEGVGFEEEEGWLTVAVVVKFEENELGKEDTEAVVVKFEGKELGKEGTGAVVVRFEEKPKFGEEKERIFFGAVQLGSEGNFVVAWDEKGRWMLEKLLKEDGSSGLSKKKVKERLLLLLLLLLLLMMLKDAEETQTYQLN